MVNHQINAAPACQRQHLIRPIRIIGIHRMIRAEILELGAPFRMGRRADNQRCPHVFRDLHPHQPNAAGGTQNHDRFTLGHPAIGNQRIMHGGQRYRQSGGFLPGHIPIRHGLHAAHIRNGIFGITA